MTVKAIKIISEYPISLFVDLFGEVSIQITYCGKGKGLVCEQGMDHCVKYGVVSSAT